MTTRLMVMRNGVTEMALHPAILCWTHFSSAFGLSFTPNQRCPGFANHNLITYNGTEIFIFFLFLFLYWEKWEILQLERKEVVPFLTLKSKMETNNLSSCPPCKEEKLSWSSTPPVNEVWLPSTMISSIFMRSSSMLNVSAVAAQIVVF